MENQKEKKIKFFSQYWGQRVVRELGLGLEEHTFLVNENVLEANDISNHYLCLKPLSSITDEDAITISYLNGVPKGSPEYYIGMGKNATMDFIKGDEWIFSWQVVDYLRSKGYALPWMGLSVEQLIEYGWLKLN